jgi:hypothetical protein
MAKNKLNKDMGDQTTYNSVIDGLKNLYQKKIRPLEELYKFDLYLFLLIKFSLSSSY